MKSRTLTKAKKNIPTILLIGVGLFGEKHLTTLQALEKKGKLSLKGAVVNTQETQKRIALEYGIEVWTTLTDELLQSVDAVDIVTPPETHTDIALQCLPFTNVLIEKPLTLSTSEAKKIKAVAEKYNRILMVGHIFRFNPVVKKLKTLLPSLRKESSLLIRGSFLSPKETDNGRPLAFELPHLFDITNFILDVSPSIIQSKTNQRVQTIDLQYGKNIHTVFTSGWEGEKKIRTLDFLFSKMEIKCDLALNTISIKDASKQTVRTIKCTSLTSPLEEEISVFLKLLKGQKVEYPDVNTGIELVSVAEKAELQTSSTKKAPKVAIIGGGIFGINCALEISKFSNVTVFEKNNDIMMEASLVNQYRHHWGYHYPRSDKTVEDIRKAIDAFEAEYNKAIVREFPTFYSIAKSSSKTTAKQYLEFCRKHNLPFTVEYPDEQFLNRQKTTLSLKTFEPIYNYDLLKKLVHDRIKKSNNLRIRFGSKVTHGVLDTKGKKILTYTDAKGVVHTESFDYVINATYAQYNAFSHWFNFPIKPVRIDLVEALIVKLPIPKISLAIMDGPFTNLVPTSKDGIFTLVHIKESMLERYVPKNGIPHNKEREKTMVTETLKKSQEWIPILKDAEIVEVRYIHRAVNAYREHDDARPSESTYHGFGCWSILGGKIVNCVSTAQEIAEEIKKQTS